MHDYSERLRKYVPEEAAPILSQWINDTGCLFRIARARSTKSGDYRPPYKGEPHRISVNHNLNPYAFLITSIHEFAHLKTWEQHKRHVKPHGQEWKANFKELMDPFLQLTIFPKAIQEAVEYYMSNPAASSCTDLNLYRALQAANTTTAVVTVEMIPEDSYFKMPNGRIFQKKHKLRKRYHCIEVHTQGIYLFHPIAEIVPVEIN